MKLMTTLLTLLFPTMLLAATTPLAKKDLAKYQACQKHSDCIYAQNGCCDCANGGQEVAVHRKHLGAFKAKFECAQVACTEMARIIPCGQGQARCLKGQCVFKSDGR